MTEQKLREKIVEVISQKQTYGITEEFKTEDLGHGGWQAWTETTKVNNAEIADALIAAGIGDINTVRDMGVKATTEAILVAAKAEHRAARAERALQKFAENITCEDCPFFSDCASSEKMEDLIHSSYCFAEYLKQAEKELAEEGKEW